MKEDMIDENMHSYIRNFRYDVSENVWNNIEKALSKKKKRRIAIYIFSSFLFTCLMVMGINDQIEVISTTNEHASVKNNNMKYHQSNMVSEHKQNTQTKEVESIEHPLDHDNFKSSIRRLEINEIMKSRISNHTIISQTENPTSELKDQQLFSVKEENQIQSEKKLIYPAPISAKNATTNITNNIPLSQRKDTINEDVYVATAAKKENIGAKKPHIIQFNAFLSTHGTGDLLGTFLEIGKEKMLSKRFSFYNNIGISLHSGQAYLGVGTNGSVNVPLNSARTNMQTVTAGIQTSPTIVFNSVGKDLRVGVGLVGRYQNSSGLDAFGISYFSSAYSSTPNIPRITMISSTKPNTLTLGYKVSLELIIRYAKRRDYGLQLFFQNDTRGDVLGGLGISIKSKQSLK